MPGKPKRAPRKVTPPADDVELLRRSSLVEAAMLAGTTTREIELHYSQEWGISTRQVRTYIARAKASVISDFTARGKETREALRAQYRAKLEFLQEKSALTGRYDWSLAALKEVGKFDGIDTGDSGTVVNVILPDWAAPTPDAE